MAFLFPVSYCPRHSQNPNPNASSYPRPDLSSKTENLCCSSKRELLLHTAAISVASLALTLALCPVRALATTSVIASPPRKSVLAGISNTKSWFQFFGNGFSIRVPPQFEDVMEPEDYNAGLSLYGDKVKPKKYAARFASPDRSEVLSVVIRPSNQLKITFLEAKDVADLGSLKEASKLFVPADANLYSARAIKIKEDESLRTYYFYEFGIADQHIALVVAVNSGKAFIAGAASPESKWEDDGVKLRSAAISLSV